MRFVDRQAKYPNRWTMLKSDGSSEIVTLIRNDEPVVVGTPMNAETLNTLSDVAGADVAREKAEAARDAAKQSETNSLLSEKNSAKSEAAAKASQAAAATSEANALKYSQEAGAKANTDKTLSIEDAPADAKQTGEELALRYTKEQVDALLAQYKADTLLAAYPVGSLYMSADATSPAELFGGTWEQIKDRFILAAGDTYEAGSTGGNSTHYHMTQLSYLLSSQQSVGGSQSYSIVMQDMAGVGIATSGKKTDYSNALYTAIGNYGQNTHSQYVTTGTSSMSSTMPPYIALYMWRRVEDAA